MRGKFINEIKRDTNQGGLSSIGVGKKALVRGYDILTKNGFDIDTDKNLKSVFDKIKTIDKPIGDLNRFEKLLSNIAKCRLEDLAILTNLEVDHKHWRNFFAENVLRSENSDVKTIIYDSNIDTQSGIEDFDDFYDKEKAGLSRLF